MKLSDTAVKRAKPEAKEYLLNDGDGLYLRVSPGGGKSWAFRYKLGTVPKKKSFGTYPEISLKRARELREEARRLLAEGIDPVEHAVKVQEAKANVRTFEKVAREWDAFRTPRLTNGRKGSANQAKRYLEKDMLPPLKDKPIEEVTRRDILKIVQQVEARGAMNVAEKIRTWFHQIFRFAIAHEYVEINPATDLDVVAAIPPPVKNNPWLELSELGEMIRRLRAYHGSFFTQKGLELLILTGVRTAEVRQATHDQFDLDKGLWTIPAGSVKQLQKLVKEKGDVPDYLVPLSRQAIEVVRQIQEHTRGYELLLPGRNDHTKQLSENTLNKGLHRLGYQDRLTGHGIRGTLSTALYEMGYPSPWIEAQLSHADENKARVAYNHAKYVDQRRDMMQAWADYLDYLAKQTGPFDAATMPRYQTPSSERS